ncbi:MAG: hypothetical protein SFY95_12430 [Planctomycetota bacterium]|nr:hypothetical protein [Planctomycetota bacterium]
MPARSAPILGLAPASASLLASVLAAALALSGCGWMTGSRQTAGERSPAAGETRLTPGPALNPFAPASVRLYPLTHAQPMGPGGRPVLVVHVEVKDAWGDSIKSAGEMVVRVAPLSGWSGLTRDAAAKDAGKDAGRGPGSAREEPSRWRIDMTEAELNSAWFDPATRTYQVRLSNLPAWMEEGIRQGAGKDGSDRTLRITAEFTALNAEGQVKTFYDELDLRL